jgi:acyl carrier protein
MNTMGTTNSGAPRKAKDDSSVEANVIAITLDLVQDWGLDLDEGVNGKTSVVKDLEFASVDIIQLCVALEQHYGRKLGFQRLLMREGSYIHDLTLGQISSFIESALTSDSGNKP